MNTEETIINLIFDSGKGNTPSHGREATVGQPIGELPIPVRNGYCFAGWYCNGKLILADTVVDEDTDMRLEARWTKDSAKRKASMLKRQKIALVALSALAVALIITFLIVSQLIAIYSLTDTYWKDDVQYQDQYIIKRQDGVYKLFDKDGNLMELNGVQKNVYIARGSGNQYKIDPETGDWTLQAVVDSGDGEYVSGGNSLLLYPTLRSSNIYSISVKQANGHKYAFFNTPNGVYIDGFRDTMLEYNQELYAQLCFGCGWTYADKKLNLADVAKLEDGSVNLAVYGLDKPQAEFTIVGILFEKDENGNDKYNGENPVIDYNVTTNEDGTSQKNYAPDATKTYTVRLGNATPSKDGFYAQMEGRNAIYILDAQYIQATVLQPIEALVVPRAVYPVNVNVHSMAYNFYLSHLDEWTSLDFGDEDTSTDGKLIAAFSYIDLNYRKNTIFATAPYQSYIDFMKGYLIDDGHATQALGLLYEMKDFTCKKLGINERVLAEFGLDRNVHYLSYSMDTGKTDANGSPVYIKNLLLISEKTEQGTYYVASHLYDMVVEVDQHYFSFLEWNDIDWYKQRFMAYPLAYTKGVSFQIGEQKYDFQLDNTYSYAFYLLNKTDSNGNSYQELNAIDLTTGTMWREGTKLYYKTLQGVIHEVVTVIDFDSVRSVSYREAMTNPNLIDIIYVDETYYYVNAEGKNIKVVPNFEDRDIVTRDDKLYYVYTQNGVEKEIEVKCQYGEPIYRYKKGIEATLSVGASGMQIYSEQYTEGKGNNKHHLDYTINIPYKDDSGLDKIELISAYDNFRALQYQMIYFSLNGEVDEKEFYNKYQMSVDEYLASGVAPYASITVTLEDYAKFFNSSTTTDENEQEVPLYEQNNKQRLVYRFYKYTDWKMMLTVELEEIDENGEWKSVNDKLVGKFHVSAETLDKLFADAERMLKKEKIDQNSKY